MTTDVDRQRPDIMITPDDETVEELTASVERRLGDIVADHDVSAMVRAALDDMSPVTVRTYLPLLVERHVRSQLL